MSAPGAAPLPALLAHDDPAAECAFGPDRAWTLQELRRMAGGVASRLDNPGGRDRLVLCRDRLRFTAAALGCWSVGDRVLLPASPAPEAIAALAEGATVLRDEDVDHDGPPLPPLQLPADRVLAVLNTSGSTGAAVAWPKTARQLLVEAQAQARLLGLAPGDRVLGTVPPHHIYGLLFSVLAPLLAGASMSTDSPLFPEAVDARLRVSGARWLVSVPAHLRALVGQPGLAGLRGAVSSGAPLPEPTARALADQAGLAVTEVLGSTETGGIAWRRAAHDPAWSPLPGVTVSVEDERLIVRSPWLPGPDPFPTADRAEALPDGRFHHLGRLDDVRKIASKRVSLGAVDAALATAPGHRDHALVVREDDDRTTLHALIVCDDEAAVRRHLVARLDPAAVPRLHPATSLPREDTGKLPAARAAALVDVRLGRADRWEERAALPEGDRSFEGHFPGMPVLPGAAVLARLVEPAVRRAWPELAAPSAVELATFQRPLRPGDVVTVSVQRAGATVRFRVDGQAGSCATGALRYG